MASDGYIALGGGRDIMGKPWEVGTRRGVLVVTFGTARRDFDDEDGCEKFAEAVARAVMPSQVPARPASGMNKVERLARDIIGIPDGL